MGTNMYPSSLLLGLERDENEALPVYELIEMADGFAGVFPGIQSLSVQGIKHRTNIYVHIHVQISTPTCNVHNILSSQSLVDFLVQNTSMIL